MPLDRQLYDDGAQYERFGGSEIDRSEKAPLARRAGPHLRVPVVRIRLPRSSQTALDVLRTARCTATDVLAATRRSDAQTATLPVQLTGFRFAGSDLPHESVDVQSRSRILRHENCGQNAQA